MLVASVLSVIGLFILNSQQHNTGSPTPVHKCTKLELGAIPTNGSDPYSATYVNSDYYACQTIGMNEDSGVAFLRSHNIVVRIATRDGISYPLTADYSEGRVNLTINRSVITAYNVG